MAVTIVTEELKLKLKELSHEPGVYHYYNSAGDLLYIGKAKDLSKRVNSYFVSKNHSPWTQLLVSEIADIRVIEVTTELEAIMLENSLIKSLRPKYNIQLKDDKTFPFLRISNDPFPIFTVTRKLKNDHARYLGPYFSATYLRSMLQLMKSLYGIKTTNDQSYEARSSVPLELGIGARNLDNQSMYHEAVEAAIKFLATPQPAMEKIIKQKMDEAVRNEEFERAAILRDRLIPLQQLRQSQSLFGTEITERDYLGIAHVGQFISAYVLVERDSKIVDHHSFSFHCAAPLQLNELTELVISYLYFAGLTIPREIFVAVTPTEDSQLKKILSGRRGRKVAIASPHRGDKAKRLATATDNAEHQLKLEGLRKSRRQNGLTDLAHVLNLPHIPKRIEAFDISNLGATNIVGASVVFIDGQPAKGEYRKYKIHTPQGQNDFASMRELVFRRLYNRERQKPDLLVVDGGRGQLSAALDALAQLKMDTPTISLAKKEELIFLPNRSEPIALPHSSDALLLLMAIRDEVHRYVISFHRHRRSKQLLPSK